MGGSKLRTDRARARRRRANGHAQDPLVPHHRPRAHHGVRAGRQGGRRARAESRRDRPRGGGRRSPTRSRGCSRATGSCTGIRTRATCSCGGSPATCPRAVTIGAAVMSPAEPSVLMSRRRRWWPFGSPGRGPAADGQGSDRPAGPRTVHGARRTGARAHVPAVARGGDAGPRARVRAVSERWACRNRCSGSCPS